MTAEHQNGIDCQRQASNKAYTESLVKLPISPVILLISSNASEQSNSGLCLKLFKNLFAEPIN